MNVNLSKIYMILIALALLLGNASALDVPRLKLATTTSLQDTGLLDVIKDKFDEKYNVTLDVVSGGTGIAIQYGERGDVDVLIVHDKERELKFIESEQGLERRCIAYNYFYIVGPKGDPAGIKGMDAVNAFKKLKAKGLDNSETPMFVSRGDNSGTHAREKLLWKLAGYNYSEINSSGRWYVDAGQGMGATLNVANEMQAYTLTDMSTFQKYKGNLTLVSFIEGGENMLNVYVAMAVNPKKHPNVNCELANKFINYLVSDEGQKTIENFGFFPARGNCDVIGCSPGECAVPTSATCIAA